MDKQAYAYGFITKCAEHGIPQDTAFEMLKCAKSLTDDELALLAKYYNTHRDDRPTFGGDVGRYFLTGGSLPLTAVYDYNRTGGTQALAYPFGNKNIPSRKRTQKQVDRSNLIAKLLLGGVGAFAGASVADPTGDDPGTAALGALAGGGGLVLAHHIVQRIAQARARQHVNDIINGVYDKKDKEEKDRENKIKKRL